MTPVIVSACSLVSNPDQTSYYQCWVGIVASVPLLSNRASARADTQMTHRKESNTESGHNTKWLITANGQLQS